MTSDFSFAKSKFRNKAIQLPHSTLHNTICSQKKKNKIPQSCHKTVQDAISLEPSWPARSARKFPTITRNEDAHLSIKKGGKESEKYVPRHAPAN